MGIEEYIVEFARINAPWENIDDDYIIWKQIRALFTSFCLINDMDADTYECDRLLQEIYSLTETEENYDTYESFMLEDIV